MGGQLREATGQQPEALCGTPSVKIASSRAGSGASCVITLVIVVAICSSAAFS